AEAEAATGLVQLRRGHAQVQQHAVQPAGGRVPLPYLREAAVEDRHPRVAAEVAARDPDGLRVLVHDQQPPVRAQLLQHPAGVAAAAEGAVQVAARRPHRQSVEDLAVQDGEVAGSRRALHATGAHSGRSSRSSVRSPSDSTARTCAVWAFSLHSSNLSPIPTSTALRSISSASRMLLGRVMRPLPSSSRSVAAPTSLNCISRLAALALGSRLTWSRTGSHTPCG